jgi:hypothetical protein
MFRHIFLASRETQDFFFQTPLSISIQANIRIFFFFFLTERYLLQECRSNVLYSFMAI